MSGLLACFPDGPGGPGGGAGGPGSNSGAQRSGRLGRSPLAGEASKESSTLGELCRGVG
jgi:hypothetical protein